MSPETARLQLDKILNSLQFRSSKRCSVFLRHVVEHAAENHLESLKERSLGIEVFGRDPDYDTNQDPVVRSTAGEVRKRLAQYYLEEGHRDEIRISLPAGSYRLSGRVLVEPGQTGDLFSWRVSCVAQPDTPIVEARQTPGAPGWRPFSANFQVGQGCPAQWLRLEGLAHNGFEPAEAWYRGLAIQPTTGKVSS